MPNLGRPWRLSRWWGRILAAIAVAVSLAVALAIVLTTNSSQAPLAARGRPLPVPSSPPPANAGAATPTPLTVAPITGAPAGTTLVSVGTNEVVALTPTDAALSVRGSAWVQIQVPSGVSGLIVDRGDADSLVAGGPRVQTTSDGGKHWAPTPAQPAGTGPFVPLLISPWDSRVFFVSHQGHVAVTMDGGSTWRDVGMPPASQQVMTSGNTAATFFAIAGNKTYQLVENGAKVNPRPSLPAGVTATGLAAGQDLLVACCASRHLLILNGTEWTLAPITTSAGSFAVHGTDLWATLPASGAATGQTTGQGIEQSSDGGVTWQSRPSLPAGEVVVSLALSGDGDTLYALTSAGEVYESHNGIWYLLSTGLRLAGPPG